MKRPPAAFRAAVLLSCLLLARSSPAPGRRVDYVTKGAVEVNTFENSIFLYHGSLYLLENIPCSYAQHCGRWDPAFANHSYARIRRMDDGATVVNITSTIGYGFVSAFVDEDFDTVWLFGTQCDR